MRERLKVQVSCARDPAERCVMGASEKSGEKKKKGVFRAVPHIPTQSRQGAMLEVNLEVAFN